MGWWISWRISHLITSSGWSISLMVDWWNHAEREMRAVAVTLVTAVRRGSCMIHERRDPLLMLPPKFGQKSHFVGQGYSEQDPKRDQSENATMRYTDQSFISTLLSRRLLRYGFLNQIDWDSLVDVQIRGKRQLVRHRRFWEKTSVILRTPKEVLKYTPSSTLLGVLP